MVSHNVHGIDLSGVMVDLSVKCSPTASFEQANMLEYTIHSRDTVTVTSRQTKSKYNPFAALSSLQHSRQQQARDDIQLSNYI